MPAIYDLNFTFNLNFLQSEREDNDEDIRKRVRREEEWHFSSSEKEEIA